MQIAMIAGNVGRDAEIRSTPGGDNVAGFSVAVDNGKDRDGNRRPATWYDCSLWGKRADSLGRYITKGTKVTIVGTVSARAHDGKAYLQIRVDQIDLQGGGRDDHGHDPRTPEGYPDQQRDLDSEIPF